MRLRTLRFIFREGFQNFFRNKLMFFASCAIITAALVILGIFLLVIFNIDENVKALGEKPQIQVYCRFDLDDAEVDALEREFLREPGLKEFTRITKEEAYERAKDMLGDTSDLLSGIGPDFLPVSFIIKLDDPGQIDDFVSRAGQMPQIEKISYPKRTIGLITRVSNWAKLFGAVIVAIPMLFAVFIISNTIRLTVFERRGEISIMRYIGATERLIRWPFVIEGAIIGVVGATFAFLVTGFGYKFLENNFNLELAGVTDDLFRLVGVGHVSTLLLVVYLLIGVGVGAVGSVQSTRKYLRV
ncbi:MAG: permease-like cell division protein FtsX [Clostridiales bacterium]|jgi:cell division transport system permease protein|nr:permease-like cell division protein FtsX [Clostridiales bacterium]